MPQSKSLLFVAAVCLLGSTACRVGAITFALDGVHLGAYDASHVSQYPQWRVGVFAEGTAAARFAPGRSHEPYVDVDVTVTNPPHEYAEAFIYRYEAVRAYDNPDGGWHPCKPQGQHQGALLPYDVPPDNGRVIYGRAVVAAPSPTVGGGSTTPATTDGGSSPLPLATDPSGGDGSSGNAPIRIQGRVNVSLTGLYVIHINACRQIGSAVLDVSGWHRARLNGRITVENPYGGIPGQAYGYLPVTIICLVLVQFSIVPLWIAFYCCNNARRRAWYLRKSMPIYQIATTLVMGAATLSYLFVIIYLGKLNATGKNDATLFGIAGAFAVMRGTIVRVAAFMFAVGHRITTTRSRYTCVVAVVAASHAFIGLLGVGLQGSTGLLTPTRAEVIDGHPEPVIAVDAITAISALLEGCIVIGIALALRRTLNVLHENVQPFTADAEPTPEAKQLMIRRRHLQTVYRRFGVLAFVTVAAGAIWWLLHVSGGLHLMQRTSDTWPLWWLPDMGYELINAAALIAFVLVTLPTPSNLQALVPGVAVDLADFEDLQSGDGPVSGAAAASANHADHRVAAATIGNRSPAAAQAGRGEQVQYSSEEDEAPARSPLAARERRDDADGAAQPGFGGLGEAASAPRRMPVVVPPAPRASGRRRALYAADSADPDAMAMDERF